MVDQGLDAVDKSNSADLQKDASGIASANSNSSKDSYTITIERLPVKLAGKYNFVFQYYYQNPDQPQSTPLLGPPSATYSVELEVPCIATTPTNVVTAGGFYSYEVKWDMPTFASYADTIVYESNSNVFSPTSKVVYVGTANQCNILTSDLLPKYVYVVHRDMFKQSCIAGLVVGPITIKDPIVVDANPPTNTFTVGSATVQDDPDGLFTFNKKVLFAWTANADTSTYGYQIRFRLSGTTDYTYMSVPGRTTISTYLYGLKAGQTYEIGVSTYDKFGNINTSDWKTYPNIVIPASTSLAADVAITAGNMKLGYGIGGDNANRGLYLGPENYWYVVGNTTAASAARLSVGGAGDKMLWDGTNLAITGNLTARSGSFTGNILLASANASIYNGTINAAGNLTGNGFALNATGLKVQNGTSFVTLDAATGQITANAGSIGGWSLSDSLLSKNNSRISSTGFIELGGEATDNIIRLDANDTTYRMWIGKNSSATAPFKVTKEGVLYATGAVLTSMEIGSTLSDGTSLTTVKNNAATGATALQPNGTLTGNVSGKINNVAVATVTAGAASGATAVQGGNGVTLAANKTIESIIAGTGLVLKSGGAKPVIIDNSGLKMNNGTEDTLLLDASTGNAVFRGTIYATAGEFAGKVTASSGSIGNWSISTAGWLTNGNTTLGSANANYAVLSTDKYIGGSAFFASSTTVKSQFDGGFIAGAAGTAVSVAADGKFNIASTAADAIIYPGLLIGVDDTKALTVNAKADFKSDLTATGANNATVLTASPNTYITSAGVIRKTSGSSIRYKKDVVDIKTVNYLDPTKLYDLPVRAFKFKEEFTSEDDSRYDKLMPGFIAEEVEQFYPIAADYDANGVEKWNSQIMIPAMLSLIQDLKTRLDAFEA
jgi:hypothetical protein